MELEFRLLRLGSENCLIACAETISDDPSEIGDFEQSPLGTSRKNRGRSPQIFHRYAESEFFNRMDPKPTFDRATQLKLWLPHRQ